MAQLGTADTDSADTDAADTVTILQILQHTATMGEEVVLTAWQLYTALFVLFWAAQLYFSSFWMSVLCCVKVSYETNIVSCKETCSSSFPMSKLSNSTSVLTL